MDDGYSSGVPCVKFIAFHQHTGPLLGVSVCVCVFGRTWQLWRPPGVVIVVVFGTIIIVVVVVVDDGDDNIGVYIFFRNALLL